MSRFRTDYDFDYDPDGVFERETNEAYAAAKSELETFLAHLDAMPSKRIISGRFYVPKTGDACAVAEFCKSAGADETTLRRAQSKTIRESVEKDDEATEGGMSCATVIAGMKAGIPQYVAYDLAWKTDNYWKRIKDGSRRMRPDERWLALRNFVAMQIGVSALDVLPV